MKVPSYVAHLAASGVVWLVMLGLPIDAAAQRAAQSFEELQVLVKTGDSVYVTDRLGQETSGRIDLLSAVSLQLTLDGRRREFLQSVVARVERRGRDPIRNGLLIGMGAGAVLGLVAGTRVDEGPCPPSRLCGEAVLTGTLGGAFWGGVIGWITDALIRKREVIYLSPVQP